MDTYEKKYKEAMKACKELSDSFDNETLTEELEKIFPELRESEDKRIKKIIKNTLQSYNRGVVVGSLNAVDYADCIAWLEKQGEQKPAEWTMDNIEELTEFENAMMHIGGSFFGEHQGLDPNDTDTIKEQANILLGLVPSKEWSEEDERTLDKIIIFVSGYADKRVNKNWCNWLKALRLQPKQEWTKEDERLRQSCIKHIEEELERIRNDKYGHSEIISDLKESCRERIKWLESLKPQNRWKPSEEQIKVLEEVIAFAADNCNTRWYDYIYHVLLSLQEQLKKLKQE